MAFTGVNLGQSLHSANSLPLKYTKMALPKRTEFRTAGSEGNSELDEMMHPI